MRKLHKSYSYQNKKKKKNKDCVTVRPNEFADSESTFLKGKPEMNRALIQVDSNLTDDICRMAATSSGRAYDASAVISTLAERTSRRRALAVRKRRHLSEQFFETAFHYLKRIHHRGIDGWSSSGQGAGNRARRVGVAHERMADGDGDSRLAGRATSSPSNERTNDDDETTTDSPPCRQTKPCERERRTERERQPGADSSDRPALTSTPSVERRLRRRRRHRPRATTATKTTATATATTTTVMSTTTTTNVRILLLAPPRRQGWEGGTRVTRRTPSRGAPRRLPSTPLSHSFTMHSPSLFSFTILSSEIPDF